MGIINSGFLTVSTFLQQHIYHVPEYQRGYSWTEDQLEDYWIDLMQLAEDDGLGSHFLGQIVVHFDRDTEKWFIIDGQKRTSTSIIILDAIRDILDYLYEAEQLEDAKIEADDLTSKYIGRVTPKRNDERLILGETDKEFFKKVVQRRGLIDLETIKVKRLSNSEELILKASKYFHKKLNELVNEEKDLDAKYNKIISVMKLILDQFKVMYVETDDINEAFIIFETLNARGKELETSDLLKNHVFRSSSYRIENIKEKWSRMIENLDNADPTKFIRHYWNGKYKFVREKDLYKNIRKEIDTPQKVEELIDTLVDLSELYFALNNPKSINYYQSPSLNERMTELQNLGAKSYYPILLALENKHYSEDDIDQVLAALECLIVRNFVVSSKVANKYEIEFAKIARQINNDDYDTSQSIVEAVRDLIISDEEFKENFKYFTTKKTPVIRYLLRKIHNSFNYETRIINDNGRIHIEHIMPKKPREWKVSEDIHKDYLWRLGNLTLLGEEYNRSATNKTFDRKKEVYKKSQIEMTKQLENYDTWTVKDIEKRQIEFADISVDIWAK